jgi:hypothetical protein
LVLLAAVRGGTAFPPPLCVMGLLAAHPVTSQAGLLEQSQARETEATA